MHPHLVTWSHTYDHLREVIEADVRVILDGQRGHERAGTFTSLRSLFGFARRTRLVFTDPSRRLYVGQAPKRFALPLDSAGMAAIRQAAVIPVQRLVVGLVTVYAIRATALRRLMLEDLDLRRRRIRTGRETGPMPELVRQLLRA